MLVPLKVWWQGAKVGKKVWECGWTCIWVWVCPKNCKWIYIIIFLIGNVQNIYNIHINLGILTFLRNMTCSFQILNTDYFYPHNPHCHIDQEGAQEDVCVNSFSLIFPVFVNTWQHLLKKCTHHIWVNATMCLDKKYNWICVKYRRTICCRASSGAAGRNSRLVINCKWQRVSLAWSSAA